MKLRHNKKNPLSIAVLLAAYNGMAWIEEQVDSILQQKKVDIDIYISVDISNDGTYEWCEDLATKNNRVKVLPYGDRFGGAAKNFFRLIRDVDFSTYDYISLADQDDIWRPGKLIRAVEKLQETGSEGYSSNATAFWPSGRELLVKKSHAQKKWDFLFEAGGPGCTYVMSRILVSSIQSFIRKNKKQMKLVWLHDWFCYCYARSMGYSWFIDEYSSLMYRQHLDNEVGVNLGLRAMLFRAKKIADGLGIGQSILFARLMGLEDDQFVKKWVRGQRIGLVWLALSANLCRRRFRDKYLFAFSCLLMLVIGNTDAKELDKQLNGF